MAVGVAHLGVATACGHCPCGRAPAPRRRARASRRHWRRHSSAARRRWRRECRGRNGSRRCRPRSASGGDPLVGRRRAGPDARVGEITSASPKPLAESRMTKPGMPPSRTSRFEPTPTIVSGISSGTAFRKAARSSSSAGWNSASASAAGAEPGDLVHLGVGRDAAAQAGKPVAKLVEQVLAAHHATRPAEFLGQRIGPLGDVAGAEEDDEVARLGQIADDRRDRGRPVDVARVAMAAGADARHQRLRGDAVDRLLAGRIDRRHHHRVGIVEAGGEFVEQIAQPGEAVRLGDRDDAALGGARAPPSAPP